MSESSRAESPSDVVARRIVAFRKRRDVTRDQLAARCAELGYPQLTGPALANIETGRRNAHGERRREVSVDELLTLARALQVAPALLLFPVGEEPAVQVTPDWMLSTWAAFRWFSGTAFPDVDLNEHWAVPIYLFREHDRLVMAWTEARVDGKQPQQKDAERELLRLRAEMHRHGLTPPALDDDMRHIDRVYGSGALTLPGLRASGSLSVGPVGDDDEQS